jgi:hypothetical protein
VTQEHLRRKETDTDKAKPTTTLRQPQTSSASNGALLATENSGDPDTQTPLKNTARTRESLRWRKDPRGLKREGRDSLDYLERVPEVACCRFKIL